MSSFSQQLTLFILFLFILITIFDHLCVTFHSLFTKDYPEESLPARNLVLSAPTTTDIKKEPIPKSERWIKGCSIRIYVEFSFYSCIMDSISSNWCFSFYLFIYFWKIYLFKPFDNTVIKKMFVKPVKRNVWSSVLFSKTLNNVITCKKKKEGWKEWRSFGIVRFLFLFLVFLFYLQFSCF
jgi:hypothetical protein